MTGRSIDDHAAAAMVTSLTLDGLEGATGGCRHGIMTSRAPLIAAIATIAALVVTAAFARPAPAWTGPVTVPTDRAGDTLAVIYSGDGGWRPLDQKLARNLADNGVPTIGIDSLAYFRSERTLDGVAQDLTASLRTYERQWGRSRVVLIGYSFGADVLPAIIPRLPADIRAQVDHVVLIGTGPHGDLRFHPASWLNLATRDSFPVAPTIAALKDVKVTCVYGDKERRDICPDLPDDSVAKIRLPGDHHFNRDYAALSAAVLRASR